MQMTGVGDIFLERVMCVRVLIIIKIRYMRALRAQNRSATTICIVPPIYYMCALCIYNIMHVRFGHKTLRRRRPTTMTPTRRPTTIGRMLRHYIY